MLYHVIVLKIIWLYLWLTSSSHKKMLKYVNKHKELGLFILYMLQPFRVMTKDQTIIVSFQRSFLFILYSARMYTVYYIYNHLLGNVRTT